MTPGAGSRGVQRMRGGWRTARAQAQTCANISVREREGESGQGGWVGGGSKDVGSVVRKGVPLCHPAPQHWHKFKHTHIRHTIAKHLIMHGTARHSSQQVTGRSKLMCRYSQHQIQYGAGGKSCAASTGNERGTVNAGMWVVRRPDDVAHSPKTRTHAVRDLYRTA